MSKKGGSVSKEDRERLATQIVAASEGLLTVPQAMKTAQLQTPDRMNPFSAEEGVQTSQAFCCCRPAIDW